MAIVNGARRVWGGLQPAQQRITVATPVFAVALLLYVATAAPGTLFGDPSEYQFIPAIWGIAHPPGYAFYTLVAGVWQRVVRVGTVAYRTNLLAAFVGAWTAMMAALTTLEIAAATFPALPGPVPSPVRRFRRWVPTTSVLVGLAVAVTPDLWQHSIHANAHILTVAITITQLWLLVCWDRDQKPRWLVGLAFLCGIGVTHHPMTVWGIPAYGLFILLRRPRIVREWGTLAAGLGAGILGLAPWLYFPLRSPTTPFGPTDMATWSGFFRHATAQGLRVNLFHFGIADQLDRAQVFLSLLRLQYGWALILLIIVGSVWLVRTRPRLAVLWGGFLLGHLAFTMNSVQDVMAYLLHPFVALGIPLGLGILALTDLARVRQSRWERGVVLLVAGLVVVRAATLLPHISLRDWRDADTFVTQLHTRFGGRNEAMAFVSDWEHLTPFFYHTYVEGLTFAEADLRPVYVTGATPWVESVYGNLPLGAVYLSNYRRDVRGLGFRLRPDECGLWRVLEPPAGLSVTPRVALDDLWLEDRIQVVGYDLCDTTAPQGGALSLVLYARVGAPEAEILMPYVRLGTVEQRWSTDSRRLTPEWEPDEIIAERYEFYIPYDLPPGSYPLTLGYTQLTGERRDLAFPDGGSELTLGTVTVVAAPGAGRKARTAERALANIGNEVVLRSAVARAGVAVRQAGWEEPLEVRPGQLLKLDLTLEVLARPSTSYTVFIHVMDEYGQLWFGHDYTPLGGAFPSYLWFPKWLPGQRVVDPYRLDLPEEMPPGAYTLEVGMYEMGSVRRVAHLAADGTMIGDRHILGPLQVAVADD